MNALREAMQAFVGEVGRQRERLYSDLPYPCELDRRIHDLIEHCVHASTTDRSKSLQLLNINASNCLWTYAKRLATQGVRLGSAEAIHEGLLAIVVEDIRGDYRVTRMMLSLIVDAALRIQADPVALFDRAIRFATPKTAEALSSVGEQYQKTKSSALTGFTTGVTKEGFTYF